MYASIWAGSFDEDQINFYFDNENVVIYPGERQGFDKVYGRIHISNVTAVHGGGAFFQSYSIKSLKSKNAILWSPKSLKGFIDDLKVLIDLGYDANFRLTQCKDAEDGTKRQYIEVTGSMPDAHGANVFKSHIEIACKFSE